MKKGKLPFRRKIKFALTVKSPLRLFFTVVLAVIAFTFTGISLLFALYDKELAQANAFADAQDEMIASPAEGTFRFEQIKSIGEELGVGCGAVSSFMQIEFGNLDKEILEQHKDELHFNATGNQISCFTEDYFQEGAILAGNAPKTEREIMISSCQAQALLLAWDLKEFEALVGRNVSLYFKGNAMEEAPGEEFTVSGVYANDGCAGKTGTVDLFDINQCVGEVSAHKYFSSIIMHEKTFLQYTDDSFLNAYFRNGEDAAFREKYFRFVETRTDVEFSDILNNLREYDQEIEVVSRYFIAPSVFFSVYAVLMLYQFSTISIDRKRGMTGILRALGCRGGDIMQIFLMESLLIGFLAGALSCVFTASMVPFLNHVVQISLEKEVNYLTYHPLAFCILMILSLSASILSAVIPVLRETKKTPIENIKAGN